MPDSLVGFAADGRVGTITLASPPANALGAPVCEGLQAALDAAAQADVKALVVRSGLDRFFAAGADVKLMATLDRDGFDAYMAMLRGALERLASFEAVSIAAIDGMAFGGGLELACACSLRVVARDAQLGVPESKLGLLPGAAGTQRLPRLIGRGRALDLLLTGRSVGGEEAVRTGLADRLAEPGEAAAGALALARELSALSRPALAAIVRSVDAAQSETYADGLEVERRELLDLASEGEAIEGLTAFLERRPPNFA